MATIPLTKGYVATVDDEDFEFLSQWKWCASVSDSRVYAMRGEGPRGKMRFIYMHRLVNDTPKGFVTDHINGDTLDNRRSNLRTATTSQNAMNTRGHRDSASRFKGVAVNSKPGTTDPKPWLAQIMCNGRKVSLGSFRTEEEAAAAYRSASRELFGEFNRIEQEGMQA